MPSRRKLHVGLARLQLHFSDPVRYAPWCNAKRRYGNVQTTFWLLPINILMFVSLKMLHAHGPPDLFADDRVCKRCVAAMDRAWKEAQG